MRCVLPFISMTTAQRGSAVLNGAGIQHRIVGIDASLTRRGCSYGIEIACVNSDSAERVLKRARIRYGDLLTL